MDIVTQIKVFAHEIEKSRADKDRIAFIVNEKEMEEIKDYFTSISGVPKKSLEGATNIKVCGIKIVQI